MPSGLKIVRPLPKPAIINRQIRKRIKANLAPLVRQHAFFRQALVAGWQPQHQPKFRGTITFQGNTINASIVIVNSDQRIDQFTSATVDDLWTWWAITGTKKHIIRPVRAKFLRFQIGSDVMFSLKIRHPGTKPNRKAKVVLRKSNAKLSGSINPLLEKSVAEGMWKRKSISDLL